MLMGEWNQTRKARFRADTLKLLSANHLSQHSRMDDVRVCSALQRQGWEVGMKPVRTILQDMEDRGWVRFTRERDNEGDGSVRLHTIMICAKGQDLVDGTTADPAARFD